LKKQVLILLLIILLTGAAIRFYNLGAIDLWFDEAITARGAKGFVTNDIQPPLYYSLLGLWLVFAPENEFTLRFLSVIFGILSLFVIYKIGKKLFNPETGLLSALILCFSPIHIWYAQEARGYTLSIFLALVATFYFVSALNEGKKWQWVIFGFFTALGLYANYYSLFLWFPEALIVIGKNDTKAGIKWLTIKVLTLVAFLPYFTVFCKQISRVGEVFWLSCPSFRSVIVTFENFNVGYSASQLVYWLSLPVYGALFLIGILALKKDKRIFLLSFLFMPLALIYLTANFLPIYIDRQLLIFSPFYYLGIACGIYAFNKIPMRISLIAAVSVLSAVSIQRYFKNEISPLSHHEGVTLKKPFKPIAQFLEDNMMPGDIVAYANPHAKVLEYYIGPVPQYYFLAKEIQDKYFTRVIENTAVAKKWNAIDITKGITQYNFERIWFLSCTWQRDGLVDDNSRAVKEQLIRHYKIIESRFFDGIYLELYERGV
jgi:mannosyltransferase